MKRMQWLQVIQAIPCNLTSFSWGKVHKWVVNPFSAMADHRHATIVSFVLSTEEVNVNILGGMA